MPQGLAQNYEQIPFSAFHTKDERSQSQSWGRHIGPTQEKLHKNKDNEQRQRKPVSKREWSRGAERVEIGFDCNAIIPLASFGLPGLLGNHYLCYDTLPLMKFELVWFPFRRESV